MSVFVYTQAAHITAYPHILAAPPVLFTPPLLLHRSLPSKSLCIQADCMLAYVHNKCPNYCWIESKEGTRASHSHVYVCKIIFDISGVPCVFAIHAHSNTLYTEYGTDIYYIQSKQHFPHLYIQLKILHILISLAKYTDERHIIRFRVWCIFHTHSSILN